MLLIHEACQFPVAAKGAVLCIGNFDGVHVGHQRMLAEGRRLARDRQLNFVVMTFDPHPLAILRPNQPRSPLMTAGQRLEILRQFEPDVVWLVKTDGAFLNMTAEEFMRSTMAGTVGAKVIVEGESFTFGRGATGTMRTLQAKTAEFGWEIIVISTQQMVLKDLSIVNVSSTLIRWLIGHGRVADAQRMMGRPYTLRGTVVHGAARGKLMGFPTLNIQSDLLLPAHGVYAGQVRIAQRVHPAAISVGVNSTFGGTQTTVEAYVLDFSQSVYDQEVDVQFISWIRDQYKFAGPVALTAQIQRDVAQIRQRLADLAGESPLDRASMEEGTPQPVSSVAHGGGADTNGPKQE